MQKRTKRWLSGLLSAVMLCTAVLPASVFAADTSALAESGTLEIYDGETPVSDEGFYLKESESKQLSVRYNGSATLPEGRSVVWESVAPYAAHVDANGLVTGRDASKRPVILAWIDENIRPLWLIGPGLADSLTNTVNNTPGIDDPEMMMDIFHGVLDPVLGESAATTLLEPLQTMINESKVKITATLVDAEGQTIASDIVWVGVNKDDSFLASFIPNGTYITNHEAVPSVVEKGYQVKLGAITTPLRLEMGVDWKVEELHLGGWLPIESDIATIDENNVITFNEPGTVRITASPDVQGLMDKIEGYLATIGGIADAADGLKDLLVYMFGDSLTSSTIDAIISIVQGIVSAGTGDDAQKMQEIVSTVANWVLRFTINDTITVEVVDQLPVESFEIIGDTVDISTLGNGTRMMTIGNIQPEGAVVDQDDVTWESSDRNVAVVEPDGKLIARGPYKFGVAPEFTIYATIDGVTESKGGWLRGDNIVNPTDLEFTGPSYLEKGEVGYYDPTVYPLALWPENWYDKVDIGIAMPDGTIGWYTANNGILSIKDGYQLPEGNDFQVLAVGGGTTTLYVRACNNNNIVKSMQVTVHEAVDGLTIDQGDSVIAEVETTLGFGSGSTQLTATLTPETATNKDVTWTSDNDKITVDENGVVSYSVSPLIRPLPASATITATSVDNPAVSDSIVVTFTEAAVHVTGVTLDRNAVSMTEGGSDKLTANVQPGDATIKDVTWASSDPAVVTVDASGNLVAVAPGDAVITVTTVDGNFTATCNVSVRADKTALNELIATVEGLDLSAVDEALIMEDLTNAKAVSAKELATQAEVDAAYDALYEAYREVNASAPLTSVQLTRDGAAIDGEVTYVKVPWYKRWNTGTATLGFQTNADVEIASVKWEYANWSIDEPEATIETPDAMTTVVRATNGVGARSCWVKVTVTDIYGNTVSSNPVKVRFYNWDWQK